MAHVPGLRSPYDKVGRLVYFGRMLDKIRLLAAGQLPAEYAANVGDSNALVFDARACRFLGVAHAELTARTLAGGTDEEILAWAHEHGTPRNDEECTIWNAYMSKLGWRDSATSRLKQRLHEYGLEGLPIDTYFDLFDLDEGRPLQTAP
jgi:gluconokinase